MKQGAINKEPSINFEEYSICCKQCQSMLINSRNVSTSIDTPNSYYMRQHKHYYVFDMQIPQIILRSEIKSVHTTKENSYDEGCMYKNISCINCNKNIGRYYIAVTSKLQVLKEKYCIVKSKVKINDFIPNKVGFNATDKGELKTEQKSSSFCSTIDDKNKSFIKSDSSSNQSPLLSMHHISQSDKMDRSIITTITNGMNKLQVSIDKLGSGNSESRNSIEVLQKGMNEVLNWLSIINNRLERIEEKLGDK